MVLLAVTPAARAVSQYWMQKGGGATVDEGYDISTDSSGNTYTTGYFTGTASFGTTTLTSSGGTDIFVVKTNNLGVFQWAVKAGGTGSDRGLSIRADAQGNSYVCGYFNGAATFGTVTLTSEGAQDVFIAKYNSSGTLQWAVRAGGAEADIGNGITIDNSGNVVVTGEFKDTASFGSTTLVSANASTDVFITKLSPAGAFTWTEHGAGNNTDRGLDVACDGAGNIYAIGQFSTTITFDVTHVNTMFNVIYLIKFNSSGTEQWFRIIGAGNSNIANSIAADATGNTWLTGDFTGTLTFFGTTNTNLSNSFDNRIFVARYDNTGTLSWASSAGSDSQITSRSIAIDGSGNAFIAGHYTCRLDEYSGAYGSGTFNSVGYSDVFVAKYTSSGGWDYSRNLGSHEDDYAYGVAVDLNGYLHYTGSFKASLNFPVSSDFLAANLSNWEDVSCTGNNSYCGDADYGKFYRFTSAGNSDVVIANCFDPNREPYDYYTRSGSGCNRDYLGVCIETGCPDTLTPCSSIYLNATTNTCPDVGPDYTIIGAYDPWMWSTGWWESDEEMYNSNGTKWVSLESPDGCFFSSDSVELVLIGPAKPTITDDLGININSTSPQAIQICGPDTIVLTAGGYGNNTILWTGPGLGSGSGTQSINVTGTGQYTITRTDSNGCQSATSIHITIHPPLADFDLEMNVPDSVEICDDESFEMWLYDSVANANANEVCLTLLPYLVQSTATITPTTPIDELCETNYFFWPDTTGVYLIEAMVVRLTACDTDTHYISKQVYAEVFPAPVITPFTLTITGGNYYCPGDSTLLVVSGGPNYAWFGTGVNGSTNDSVYVSAHDWYEVTSSVNETNSYGCTSSYSTEAGICVAEKPQPIVTAASLLICPDDSVLLTCIHHDIPPAPILPDPCEYRLMASEFTGSYQWEGPNGPIASDTSAIYVTDPGSYYCTFNDSDSCALLSNTVLLFQYTTPSLIANGDLVLCEGDSLALTVVANDGSLVEWLPPLSGSGLQKTVYEPGTYTCKITSCNIETYASMEVLASYVKAEINADKALCIGDTITLHGSAGMDTYLWTPGGETTDSIRISAPGTFTLVTTDTNGCQAVSDTVTITMDQVPTLISLDTIPWFCAGDSIVLGGNPGMQHYVWTPSGDTTQSHTAFTPGLITLTTTDTNGCQGSDSITLFSPDTNAPLAVIGDTVFCEGGVVTLRALGQGFSQYTWNPGNHPGKELVVDTTGTYVLTTVDSLGCLAYSRNVQIYVEPRITSKPVVSDTLICAGTAVTLRATADRGTIHWYDAFGGTLLGTGETYTTPVLYDNTVYYLWSATTWCDGASVPLLVQVQSCGSIEIPNVFTPNGDGVNDLFRVTVVGAECFHCSIYNRWGVLVSEWSHVQFGWDGTLTGTGEPATEGTYFYTVEYCKPNKEVFIQQGTVTLIREKTPSR